MHALVSVWTMAEGRLPQQQRGLHEQIVPVVSKLPGFEGRRHDRGRRLSYLWLPDTVPPVLDFAVAHASRHLQRKAYLSLLGSPETAARRAPWFASRSPHPALREPLRDVGVDLSLKLWLARKIVGSARDPVDLLVDVVGRLEEGARV